LSDSAEKIYSSAPSEADDDFWLGEGKRMVMESLASVRSAANSLIASLGMLQGFYLGILTLDKPLPPGAGVLEKTLFIAPIASWLVALYLCIAVIMTKKLPVFTNSPGDIREKSRQMLLQKQNQLQWAVALLTAGLLAAFALFYRKFSRSI